MGLRISSFCEAITSKYRGIEVAQWTLRCKSAFWLFPASRGEFMKRTLFALAAACLLLTTGCGDDSKVDPNAPIANQPTAAANGWTADQIAMSSERCAAYGLISSSNTRYQSWLAFCSCGYSAIAAVPNCTYDYTRRNSRYCINQASAGINQCKQSSGLSQAAYSEQYLEQY